MGIKAGEHKGAKAKIVYALASYALMPFQGALGLTAKERFGAMQKLDRSGSVITSRWFTVTMLIVLVCSVVAFVLINWYKKRKEGQTEDKTVTGASVSKPAQAGINVPVVMNVKSEPQAVPVSVKPVDVRGYGEAFIALYPFEKKLESPEEQNKPLPQFLPAMVVGVAGRVISVETTLRANVGDRVLFAFESDANENGLREIIEDTGIIKQSVQPAQSGESPDTRRLAIEPAQLSDAQTARISAAAVKTTAARENAK